MASSKSAADGPSRSTVNELAFVLRLVTPTAPGIDGGLNSALGSADRVMQHPNFGPLSFLKRVPPLPSLYHGFATPFRCIERVRLVFEVPHEGPLHAFAFLSARTLTRGWTTMFRPHLSAFVGEANVRLTVNNHAPMPPFDEAALRLDAARFPHASDDGAMTLVVSDRRSPGVLYIAQWNVEGFQTVDVRQSRDGTFPEFWTAPVTRDDVD